MHDSEQILARVNAMTGLATKLLLAEHTDGPETPKALFLRADLALMADTLARSLRNE